LSYVREAHGGQFRLVAFSALLDTAERPDSQQKDSNMQTTRVIRYKDSCCVLYLLIKIYLLKNFDKMRMIYGS